MSESPSLDVVGPGTWEIWTLEDFDSEYAEVVLPGGMRIARLSDKDARAIMGAAGSDPDGEGGDVLPRFVLIAPVHDREQGPDPQFEEFLRRMSQMENVLLALRLIRPGRPLIGLEIHLWGGDLDSWLYRDRRAGRGGTPYLLRKSDLDLLVQLITALGSVAPGRPVARAADRFDSLYARTRDEDHILDLWIALESLFLSDGGSGELRFRAALRAAHYCGHSSSERWNIFTVLRRSYDFRSLVIHGSEFDRGRLGIIVNDTWAILRTAIRKALVSGSRIDLEGLDRQAVRGEESDADYGQEK